MTNKTNIISNVNNKLQNKRIKGADHTSHISVLARRVFPDHMGGGPFWCPYVGANYKLSQHGCVNQEMFQHLDGMGLVPPRTPERFFLCSVLLPPPVPAWDGGFYLLITIFALYCRISGAQCQLIKIIQL